VTVFLEARFLLRQSLTDDDPSSWFSCVGLGSDSAYTIEAVYIEILTGDKAPFDKSSAISSLSCIC